MTTAKRVGHPTSGGTPKLKRKRKGKNGCRFGGEATNDPIPQNISENRKRDYGHCCTEGVRIIKGATLKC